MEELGKKVKYGFWEKYDDNHTVVRFATSWATKMEDIDALIEIFYLSGKVLDRIHECVYAWHGSFMDMIREKPSV